jgi:hypothetical protein
MKAKNQIPTGIRWKIAATAGVIAVSAFGMSMVSAERDAPLPDQIRLKDAVPVSSNSGERLAEPQTQFKVVPGRFLSVSDSPYDSTDASVQIQGAETSPFDSAGISDDLDSPFDSPGASDSVASPYDSPDASDSVASPYDSPDASDSVASPYDSPDDSDSVASAWDSPDDSDSFDSPDNS